MLTGNKIGTGIFWLLLWSKPIIYKLGSNENTILDCRIGWDVAFCSDTRKINFGPSPCTVTCIRISCDAMEEAP